MKLWSGRFVKEQDSLTDLFNSSLSFDFRLYKQDILGSIAHATMLSECKIITKDEGIQIIDGLKSILFDIENNKLTPNDSEDIHMFIESELTNRIGENGKKLHTARSRNDQVTTDFKLYILDEIKEIKELLINLIKSLCKIGLENLETYMPGFTHMQKAQPITLAHYLIAYAEMFKRDVSRLNDSYNRSNVLPLGAGALAGTTYSIDRYKVMELLNFKEVSLNSLDSVSDRDYALEFLFDCSMIIMHLSRFCEEIITFSSDEYRFFELDDSYSTGSSIMPQKKNPDIAELIRGKSGRIFGNLIALLTVMKGLPLAYNKDMQEDKESVFDTADTIKLCLKIFIPMFETLKFNKDRMEKSAMSGYTNATDVADYLVKKGIPFRTAHKISGEIVLYAINKKSNLNDLSLNEYKNFDKKFDKDIYEAISLNTVVNNRKSIGGCSPNAVKDSIEKILNQFKEN